MSTAVELPSVFRLAVDWTVVRRALIMATIVGTLLVAINHGHCIAVGEFGGRCMVQSTMTYFVPYAVSTISSIQAIRCRARHGVKRCDA